jgi:beta-fructofuranosidase
MQYSTDYITALTTAVDKSAYRNSYHIQPKIGLLNDPNGFSSSMVNIIYFTKSFPMVRFTALNLGHS